MRRSVAAIAFVIGLHLSVPVAQTTASAQSARKSSAHENWIPTWTTSQQLVRFPPAPPATPPATAAPAAAPVPANTPPPQPPLQTLNNQTVRMFARTSIGGKRVRVKLANAFNGARVEIGAAHIALRDRAAGDSNIAAGSDRKLTFGGMASIKMAPGAVAISDPVDLAVSPLTDLAVSLYFPGETGPPTTHATGLRTTFVSAEGDHTASPSISGGSTRL